MVWVRADLLEAAADGGALKTARKGVSGYRIIAHGRAAHSGLEPQNGINSTIEIAHQILALRAVAAQVNAETGPATTTVTPTLLSAGTAANTVPAQARVTVDVRTPTLDAQQKVHELILGLTPVVPGARLEIQGGPNRPPLDPELSAELFALAAGLANKLGQPPLTGAGVGGASDGNFAAGVGCRTLDGLGGVGGGAHADHEHVITAEMPTRALLLAELVGALR